MSTITDAADLVQCLPIPPPALPIADDHPWWDSLHDQATDFPARRRPADPLPLIPTGSLAGYVAIQAAWYRHQAAEEPWGFDGVAGPREALAICAETLESLYLSICAEGHTSTDQVRESDPLIGSDYPRGRGQTETGVAILDEVHRYLDQRTEAAELVADVLEQAMYDADSQGSLEYMHKLARIRDERCKLWGRDGR